MGPIASTPDLLLGTQLGGYRIDALIGRGGMSRVYKAEQLALRRHVALKVLAPHLAADEDYRERFLQESRLAASIEHPNILPIYDAGESSGYLYIAMRLVEGTDLRTLLAREGALSPARALSFLTQAALALDAAHDRGLVHRDVKPANLLLSGEHLFLTDFGVAKIAGDPSGLTRIGVFVGTMEYAAPEQIRIEALDGRTDLYALACVFYQCLVGKAPFDRPTEHLILQAHLNEMPPSIRQERPELPSALDAVFTTALAKHKESRFRSGRFLADAARWALEGRVADVRAQATVIDGGVLAGASIPMSTAPLAVPEPRSAGPTSAPLERARATSNARRWVLVGGVGLLLAIGVVASLATTRPPDAAGLAASAAPITTSLPSPPTRTVAPSTPTPAPTRPFSVTLRPEQMIMPPTQFPLVGYTVSLDEAIPPYGWQRDFASTTRDYWWVQIYLYVFSSGSGASRVASTTCTHYKAYANNGDRLLSQTEITAPLVGEGAKACLHHFEGTTSDMTEYITATRNVQVFVVADPKFASNAQALSLVVQLARQQIGIIDRVAPP